jgi:uncharacterized protein RhaS with RHS repeats
LYETSCRSYDPQIGRFAQADPIGDKYNFLSQYQYAFNNPIYFNDASGADPRLDQLLNSSNGGTFSAGSMSMFSSMDEAFGYGAYYMSANGAWGKSPGAATSFDNALQRFNGGNVTAGMAQALFAITWGSAGQATNVSAGNAIGGFDIGGVATSSGNEISDYIV